MNINDMNFIVMGFSMTGYSVAKFLIKKKANVTLTALEDLSLDNKAKELMELGVKIVDKGHPLSLLTESIDYIIKNPGIPYHVDFIVEAQKRQIPIITDVELASWFNRSTFIGVTGSNGKTTTTQLIYELLCKHATGHAYLAGNIGVPIMETVQRVTENDFMVAELSSFQLEGTNKIKPNIAVLNNIYEAHLDYHGSRMNYIHAKLKLIENMTSEDILIYNSDQEEMNQWIKESPAKKVPFSLVKKDNFIVKNGTYVEGNSIYFMGNKVAEISDIQIPGKHNIMNVLAAISVVKSLNMANDKIIDVLRKYQGMPHRIQPLGEYQGRLFFNDSKATNIVATQTALRSFNQPIIYIGGGLDRGNSFDELIPYLRNVKAAYLYGETKDKLHDAFQQAQIKTLQLFNNLTDATEAAYLNSSEGDVVLFSPACASWDQFKNYEIRGEKFIQTIERLKQTKPL